MQGSGKTYEYSGETTEWEDILIKKGITTREDVLLGKGLDPSKYMKSEEAEQEEDETEDILDQLNIDDIDELEEDECSDSRILDHYRQKRIAELRESAARNRFGDVRDIVKNDWIDQVTEGSKSCTVVVHLYENNVPGCAIVDECIRSLAPRFKYIKFLRIKSTNAIENWPEANLPTLFVYKDGSMSTQAVTLKQLNGIATREEDVEWFLVKGGVITDSELEEDPRNKSNSKSTVFRATTMHNYANDHDSDDDL